ncbi:MAG TPA: cation:proton antiporter, partial [Glaciihabitans sp.]|nr:cation:proton antiporter [Glaciihabitans sp.]
VEIGAATRVAEIALALLLFHDAARLDIRHLRKELQLPSRLLLVGLPLCMLFGTVAGVLLFPEMALASVVLLAIMLSPTDAALGQKVITDTAVPARVRQALDVESGLNDGLAVPFFLVALEIANAELETGITWAVLSSMAAQIGWGVICGVVVGLLGGILYHEADTRGWISQEWRQVIPLAIALLVYAAAIALGGSGFIAAFVGGIAFGTVSRAGETAVTELTEATGDLFAAVTWILFGALTVPVILPLIDWRIMVYAVLSLTLVRMIPVMIAFAGQLVRRPTTVFIGWFGPRGLASLVFALLAVEHGIPDGTIVLPTVLLTVALSVLLHGLTSVPLVAAYSRWFSLHPTDRSTATSRD